MVVDGKKAYLNIRIFTDDLRDGLRRFHHNNALEIHPDLATEQKFLPYLNQKFVFNTGGRKINAQILNSRKEDDMMAYTIEYSSPRNIASFYMKYQVLMELYDDQRNIFKVIKAPSDVEQSYLFFQDATSQLVTF